ncbi:hypothetical protein [Kurthia senegalensis]|uniref:hypothetical protein n=1 Tax=Kurthia senegalensis TaxID=1033740 RepID=UPI0002896FEF|nr:hypothetical protein [Kurthia senegalensis]
MLQQLTKKSSSQFIGLGSTRKVDRHGQFVIKTFLHELGKKQSDYETKAYAALYEQGLHENVAPILYVDDEVCVQPYFRPVPKTFGTYSIDFESDPRVTDNLRQAIVFLKETYQCVDIFDSSNYALNNKGKLVLIDYGMSYEMYVNEWAPLAKQGILPQMKVGTCESCGIEKELRLYGAGDEDRRCVTCGKL